MKPTALSRFLFCAGIALASCCSAATHPAVYRCGPNGNQYSDQPCAQGKAVDVADPRSPQQVDEARKSVVEARKLGYLMAKERREEERARPALAAGNLGPRGSADQARSTLKLKKAGSSPRRAGKSAVKTAEGSEFTAYAPASRKKKQVKSKN